jgi:hypothetical protein
MFLLDMRPLRKQLTHLFANKKLVLTMVLKSVAAASKASVADLQETTLFVFTTQQKPNYPCKIA